MLRCRRIHIFTRIDVAPSSTMRNGQSPSTIAVSASAVIILGRRDSRPYRPAGLRSRRCGGNDLGPYLQRGCAFLVVCVRQVGVGNEAAQAYDTSLQNTTAMGANSAQQHDT